MVKVRKTNSQVSDFNSLLSRILSFNLPLICVSLILSYVGTFYLRLPMDKAILYTAEDPGYVEPPSQSNPIIGVHRFNDFLQTLSYTLSPNPYNPDSEYPSMYGPLGHLLLKPLVYVPQLFAVTLLSLITCCVLILAVRVATPKLDLASRIIFTCVFLLLSKPFLLTLDRGNIQGIIVGINVLFLYCLWNKKNGIADILLIISICVKIYPIIFLIYFLKTHEFVRIIRIMAISALITMISYTIMSGNFNYLDFARGIAKGAAIQSGFPTSGVSASSWFLRWIDATGLREIVNGSNPGIRTFQSAVALILVLILTFSILKRNLSPGETGFLLLGYSAAISPVSWNYNLLWVTFGLLILMSEMQRKTYEKNEFERVKKHSSGMILLILWSFHLLVVPWIWLGSSRISVSISELTYFPLLLLTNLVFVCNSKKRKNAKVKAI